MASVLDLVSDAADDIGIPRPTTLVGSSDLPSRTLLAAANRECRELARRYGWQALKRTTSFTTVAAETQTDSNAYPTDLDHIVPDTMWNTTRKLQVMGPWTDAERADAIARGVSGSTPYFQVRAGALLIYPAPTAGQTVTYTYISKYWAGIAGSTTATLAAWTADTNIPYLDEEAIRLGVVWRYKKSRGLEYGEDFNTYERHVAQLMGRDGSRRVLSMGSRTYTRKPSPPIAPDYDWDVS